jgi:4'-phosphopantetheinyl transferase
MINVIIQVEKIPENFNEARYLPVLNREELFRYQSFKDTARKRQFLFSRFLLKNKLFEVTGQNSDDIHFEIGSHGKPFLPGKRIHFNISHSENYVAYVIAKKEVGIDIQAQRTFSNLQGLIERVSHVNEKTFLENSLNLESDFLKLWNLKEAYSKCLGLGIQVQFSNLDFSKLAQLDSSTFQVGGQEFEVSFKILDRTPKIFLSIFKALGDLPIK